MEFWDQVINTAMLGTDKGAVNHDALPDELRDINIQLAEDETWDKETRFLNQAALAFNYRQSGFLPFKHIETTQPTALPEEQLYCPQVAQLVLNDVLALNNSSLLTYWLVECRQKQWIVLPDVLTTLLDKAFQQVALREAIVACSGNRGLWLSQYNPQWGFFRAAPDEEIWQTGKPEQRVKLLQRLSATQPAKALEWLRKTWPQETAPARADLLKAINPAAASLDLPWLESLSGEKNQKVRDEVIRLLRQMPASSIVKSYETILRESVSLKTEKAFLGMIKKTALQIHLPGNIDQGIFKTGIEKLSNNKKISDELFIIYQLTGFVPPIFWETHLNLSIADVAECFTKDETGKILFPAIAAAAMLFDDMRWLPYLLKSESPYLNLADELGSEDHGEYLLRFFNEEPVQIIHRATQSKNEWSLALTIAMFKYQASNPYQYNKTFHEQNIMLIPLSVLGKLDAILPKEANHQPVWLKTCNYIKQLLNLKQQIQQAFNQ